MGRNSEKCKLYNQNKPFCLVLCWHCRRIVSWCKHVRKIISHTADHICSDLHVLIFMPLACAECDNSLLFSGASSIPLCYILLPPFSTNYSTILPHFIILPSWSTSLSCPYSGNNLGARDNITKPSSCCFWTPVPTVEVVISLNFLTLKHDFHQF
jgi:hypothetical protein